VIRGEQKVTSSHLERAAIVYVRQSTLVQVREHTESTLRQYDLAGQAARLGWPGSAIEVIDADLGLSGRTASHRDGFKHLIARVCLGEVGAVFGLEVSRLARSSADLARLLELARLTSTLVIDGDGAYDLSDINDRLLLGLKSQMSEAELHWLASRMHEARRAAARRGELRLRLPAGLACDEDGNTVIDPDQEVAAAISDVFAAFTATGSAYGVVGAFAGRRFPSRAHHGAQAGQLRWGPLTYSRVIEILRNPAYAGAYVFGRRRSRQVVSPDGSVRSSVTRLPRQDWEVVIRDHHPGYITWEDYLASQEKLAANHTSAGARPPREGTALCQGIIYCGTCGHPMQVRYQGRYHPSYECTHSRPNHRATPRCPSVRARAIDAVAADALLAAVAPDQVTLALAAAGEVTARRQRSVRAAELAAERARYDADRAERAFLACDPENRLVARTLEARWEARLTDLADAQAALATQRAAQPELPAPGQLAATIADLPALWADPATSDKDRKRLLRALLADVTITPDAADRSRILVGLRWKSGASQQIPVTRPKTAIQLFSTSPAAVGLARQIGPGLDNNALAAALSQAGHRTGTGRPFSATAAGNLRNYHRIPYPRLLDDGELTLRQAAERAGVAESTIHYWINAGYLAARRGPAGRWAIPFPPEVEQACRDRAARSPHYRDTHPGPRNADELGITETAGRLGVKPDVVGNWVQQGHLPAVAADEVPGAGRCLQQAGYDLNVPYADGGCLILQADELPVVCRGDGLTALSPAFPDPSNTRCTTCVTRHDQFAAKYVDHERKCDMSYSCLVSVDTGGSICGHQRHPARD
jgi:DNA invertase Pin-like site-specific DNA recombinase